MTGRNLLNLDQLDIQLIRELESDARQTYKDIATKLNVDRTTVVSRVRRLMHGGVVRTICWADPLFLGYEFSILLLIDVRPGWDNDVAEKLAVCQRVIMVHLCTGTDYNIVAWALFRNADDLSFFLSKELKPIPGILHIETMLILQQIKVLPKLLTAENEPCSSVNLENNLEMLDEKDLNLIKELQADARQKSTLLGQKLGVHQSTVCRRMQRLIDKHIIQIGASTNPFALGYEGVATIGLKCSPGKAMEVANAIALYNQVQYVGMCAGRYDVTAWVVFQKLRDLSCFINVELGKIPGLVDKETVIYYKTVKMSMQLVV